MATLGSKFQCSECDTKFYDLGREQALCPQCGHEMKKEDPLKVAKAARKRTSVVKKKTKKATKKKKAAASSEEE